ncbi:MAG TPA: hypothetical protein VHV29_18815 [Terriglobales bacterium]|jgi:hypothetical protein|nr:hypothetical protein [Terriglobales bacterium]
MNFLQSATKHSPAEEDDLDTPRMPGLKEPEPDTPEPDRQEDDHGLDGVQVREELRPEL